MSNPEINFDDIEDFFILKLNGKLTDKQKEQVALYALHDEIIPLFEYFEKILSDTLNLEKMRLKK